MYEVNLWQGIRKFNNCNYLFILLSVIRFLGHISGLYVISTNYLIYIYIYIYIVIGIDRSIYICLSTSLLYRIFIIQSSLHFSNWLLTLGYRQLFWYYRIFNMIISKNIHHNLLLINTKWPAMWLIANFWILLKSYHAVNCIIQISWYYYPNIGILFVQ